MKRRKAQQAEDEAASSPAEPYKRKPGPKPVAPTTNQRGLVELAIAIGMTVDQISAVTDMARRTLYRAFKREFATGRARRLLASTARLDAMANAGNVAAAKYLHSLMLEGARKDEAAETEDDWSDVVGVPIPNLAQKRFSLMAKRTMHDLRTAAKEGDYTAIRALLRHANKMDLLREVKRGQPLSPRVQTMVRAMTAGTGTRDELDEWEFVNENGDIECLLHPEPLPARLLRKSDEE